MEEYRWLGHLRNFRLFAVFRFVIARKGLRNVMILSEILRCEMQFDPTARRHASVDDCSVMSLNDELFETMIDLGENVKKDQIDARIWQLLN